MPIVVRCWVALAEGCTFRSVLIGCGRVLDISIMSRIYLTELNLGFVVIGTISSSMKLLWVPFIVIWFEGAE